MGYIFKYELAVMLAAIAATSHAIVFLISNSEYRHQTGHKEGLYINGDIFSAICGNCIVIISSMLLAIIGTVSGIALAIIPLLVCCWCLFIRDRFRSLGRGLGAPGYFSFFQVLAVFILTCYSSVASGVALYRYFCVLVLSIAITEFSCIFISAGSFKFGDLLLKRRPLSFALGLKNPMWSKVWKRKDIIQRFGRLMNISGPAAQLAGGMLIATPSVQFQIAGCMIVSSMFILIAPFARLGWLCVQIVCCGFCIAIAAGKLELLSRGLEHTYLVYGVVLAMRIGITLTIFEEYFLKSHFLKGYGRIVSSYRNAMGCIAWRVFTYELVKYVIPTLSWRGKQSECQAKNTQDIEKLIELSSHTSVYDSITVAALLNSREYLNAEEFEQRIQKYMRCYSIDILVYLVLRPLNEESFYGEKDAYERLTHIEELRYTKAKMLSHNRQQANTKSFKSYR